jgi:hypothetical protein
VRGAWTHYLYDNMSSIEIRNALGQSLVKPELHISIPDIDTAFWSKSIGVERPDHLNVFRFTSDLRLNILRKETTL